MAVQQDDWDRHWDDYADAAQQNPAQAFRRKLVFDLLGLGSGPARLLDIGSGQGDFAAEVAGRFPAVELLGLEMSAEGIEISKRKAPRASFLEADLTQPQQPPQDRRGWATHAVCSEVLEHVDDPEAVLVNSLPFMGPGCRLVVTVPGGPMSAFDRHIGHRRHFDADDLRGVIEAAGLEVDLAGGAGYPFFNLYRRAVIMRGEKLVDDIASDGGTQSRFASAAMTAFGLLFKLNRRTLRGGWQTVAVAHSPAVPAGDGG